MVLFMRFLETQAPWKSHPRNIQASKTAETLRIRAESVIRAQSHPQILLRKQKFRRCAGTTGLSGEDTRWWGVDATVFTALAYEFVGVGDLLISLVLGRDKFLSGRPDKTINTFD
jgi:hypothetical protein